jgi:glyoxylase-like metal-dependent hydrolase (beta-lactamase superfamily II)
MALPDGVTLLLAPNPSPMTLTGTNTYLVRGAAGCAVIDPGPMIERHLVAVAEEGQRQGGIRAILITHGHPDHVEGAPRLRELTGAPIIAWSKEGVADANETLEDEALFTLGDRGLRALFTPGHRYDHLSFALEANGRDTGVIFAGDLVAGAGTVVIAPPDGNLRDYLAALRRILAREPALLAPGHGSDRADASALITGYIAHREDRESQLLSALSATPRSVADLVARIYTDTPTYLHPVAAYSTLAGLLKLEEEGRVAQAPSGPDDASTPVAEPSGLALEGVIGRPAGLDAYWRLIA